MGATSELIVKEPIPPHTFTVTFPASVIQESFGDDATAWLLDQAADEVTEDSRWEHYDGWDYTGSHTVYGEKVLVTITFTQPAD